MQSVVNYQRLNGEVIEEFFSVVGYHLVEGKWHVDEAYFSMLNINERDKMKALQEVHGVVFHVIAIKARLGAIQHAVRRFLEAYDPNAILLAPTISPSNPNLMKKTLFSPFAFAREAILPISISNVAAFAVVTMGNLGGDQLIHSLWLIRKNITTIKLSLDTLDDLIPQGQMAFAAPVSLSIICRLKEVQLDDGYEEEDNQGSLHDEDDDDEA